MKHQTVTPKEIRPTRRQMILGALGIPLLTMFVGCPQDTEEIQRQMKAKAEAEARRMADQAIDQAKAEAQRQAQDLLSRARQEASDQAQRAVDKLVGAPPRFEALPVPFDAIDYVNWYGNTEFAYSQRDCAYADTQGFHSGLDFVVALQTPVSNTTGRPLKVLSLDQKPYDFGAGPHSVLLDSGAYVILFGHAWAQGLPKFGATIRPGELIARSGADSAGLAHLHLEVIRKDSSWDDLPDVKKQLQKPGNTRVNPVPLFSVEAGQQLEKKAKGVGAVFHRRADGRWQTPDDQPDITPGGSALSTEPKSSTPCP